MVEGSWHTVAGGAGPLWGYKSLGGIRTRPRPPKNSHDVRISGIWRKWKTPFRGPQRGLMVSKVINDGKD